MKNVKLIVAYDGTQYCGWQRCAHKNSIESTLTNALQKILQCPLQLQAASRTDAGVHADGQVVNFCLPKEIKDFGRLHMSLNRLLPKDISVIDIEYAPLDFHPSLDAKGKEYRYFVCYGKFQLPRHRHYSWHYHYFLDFELMRQAAKLLIGKQDFSSLCNQKRACSYLNFTREIHAITLHNIESHRFFLAIRGNHFLYKMARNIAGLLLGVGSKKIALENVKEILLNADRAKAGITAPAHALFLHRIFY